MNYFQQKSRIQIFVFLVLMFFVSLSLVSAQTPPAAKSRPKATSANIYTLPSGMVLRVRMDSGITSKTATVNDTFTTTVVGPVLIRNVEVIPANTVIEGRITKVIRAKRSSKRGELEVAFENLKFPNGASVKLSGILVDIAGDESSASKVEGKSLAPQNATIIGAGAGTGAMIGAAADGGSGAAIGATIGAGVGIIQAIVRKGNEATIPTNHEIGVALTQDVVLPVKDF